jgi:hypothetical protein
MCLLLLQDEEEGVEVGLVEECEEDLCGVVEGVVIESK